MLDRFNRNIDYLRISVTDRCNLRCSYCISNDYRGLLSPTTDILSYEEITEIARIASCIGLNKIRITGGEPLVRKGISNLIKSLNSIDTISRISLTTNGTLLSSHAKDLYESGLREVNISLDTLNEARFVKITNPSWQKDDMQKLSLSCVLEGINTALRYDFLIKLNVVMMKDINDDEILDFARWTKYEPIIVRFIELMPIGNKGFCTRDRFISADKIKDRCRYLGDLYPAEETLGTGPARYYKFKNGVGRIGFISPVSEPFCKNCNRLRLTSDGLLKVCLDSALSINLKPALRPWMNKESLKGLFVEALKTKPEGHFMNYQHHIPDREFSMCGIGG